MKPRISVFAAAFLAGLIAGLPIGVDAQTATWSFKGGIYKVLKKTANGTHAHHTPAADAWRLSGRQPPFRTKCGPSIEMDPEDHRKTASYGTGTKDDGKGGRVDVEQFRRDQAQLIRNNDVRGAIQKDIDNITDLQQSGLLRFDYTEAIAQMLAEWESIKDHLDSLDQECRPPTHPEYAGSLDEQAQQRETAEAPADEFESQLAEPTPATTTATTTAPTPAPPPPEPAPEPDPYYWEPVGEWHADGSMC